MAASDKVREHFAKEAKQEKELLSGVSFVNETQDKDMKENMVPDPENAKMVRQGRMNPKNGMDCATPKTLKANQWAITKEYCKGYDGIKFYPEGDDSWRVKEC
jgi:hypothetical protein